MELRKVVEFFHRDPLPRLTEADLDEFRALGASESDIDAMLDAEAPDEDCEVLEENWDAVLLYESCYGKFLTTGFGHVIGFDFNAVRSDIELSGTPVSPDTWQKFKHLERFTVTYLNQRKR